MAVVVITTIILSFRKDTNTEQFNTAPTTTQLTENSVLYTNQNGDISTWRLSDLLQHVNETNNSTIQSISGTLTSAVSGLFQNALFIKDLLEEPYIFIKGPNVEFKLDNNDDKLNFDQNNPLKILDGANKGDFRSTKIVSKYINFNELEQKLTIEKGGTYRIEFNTSILAPNGKPAIKLMIYKKPKNGEAIQLNKQTFRGDNQVVIYGSVKCFALCSKDDTIYFDLESSFSHEIVKLIEFSIMVDRISSNTDIPIPES